MKAREIARTAIPTSRVRHQEKERKHVLVQNYSTLEQFAYLVLL